MTETIKIRCKSTKKIVNIEKGSSLFEIFSKLNLQTPLPPVCAKVNNQVQSMDTTLYYDSDVEFLDLKSDSGSRVYCHSLFFVLSKAVHDVFPGYPVMINIPVSNGYYCYIKTGKKITTRDVDKVRRQMQKIIDAALPLKRLTALTEDAIKIFEKDDDPSKVKLLKSLGTIYTNYCELDGYVDFYYGALVSNTSELKLFGLEKYYDGMLLRTPSRQNPEVLGEFIKQPKMFEIFKEQHRWQEILGVTTVGDFNNAVLTGHATDLINISEALQEKKISQVADMITCKKGVKVVLISGPSSSGKTTFSKRLSLQLVVNGKRPVPVSLDDYFVDRTRTPLDEKGDYDYESLYALDLKLLNKQLNQLFAGKEVELPRYDFKDGTSKPSGRKLKLGPDDILVLEGIHALNPELTKDIADENKFRIYASALTSILLDWHNYIHTTDNRLLRRIIRDHKYRGITAEQTILRWPSVRAGENKWIFPYQENADVMFNTALLFEIGVIKSQAEPLLEQVPQNSPAYSEAYRLLKFLKYFKPIPNNEIPPTSLIREFLGGSSFNY
ncbi:MAG: nucleoside kinase [Prevotellaceae bacterium]|nr:nucleoside kinase [Prevotellaceae bacterium]